MSDFDSVKIGVCDAYWIPPNGVDEIFLGLTKGGCELTYTPEWYDLQVDRYGRSPTDSALVGEAIAVRIPLAETDMKKLELFTHTSTKVLGHGDNSKLTFGRFPGFRLGNKAGRLRLHPIAMGTDRSEDIVIYKAVNKAPLQLNYRLEEERIFQTEFIGMIQRKHINGALLWEIGDSTMGTANFTLSSTLDINGLPTNLQQIVQLSGGSLWVTAPEIPVYTEDTDIDLRTTQLKAYVEFNGVVYNITQVASFSLPTDDGVWHQNRQVVDNINLPGLPPNLANDAFGANMFADINVGGVNGRFVAKSWEGAIMGLNAYKIKGDPAIFPDNLATSWAPIIPSDNLWVVVRAQWGSLTGDAAVVVQIA